jgi:tetratricopeptide (TPR) repeat protein
MKSGIWLTILLIALTTSVVLQRWIDAHRSQAAVIEETLYVNSGKTIKRLSLGYHSFVADVYWLRAIQYFGKKLQAQKGAVNIYNVKDWRLDLLYPLLSLTSELDPKFIQPIRFGAIFLPDIDAEKAIAYVQSGIEANPQDWRLSQDLGFIYWQQKRYAEAAATYEKGGQLPGAPEWFRTMQAVMLARGGDRETSRLMFQKIHDETDDKLTKGLMASRLKYFQAEDEIALLNDLLAQYRAQAGSCPSALNALVRAALPQLRQSAVAQRMNVDERLMPLDPEGTAYVLDKQNCTVSLAEESKILPFKL